MTKKLKLIIEFSSLFKQPKWITEIRINNFNSKREKDNKKIAEDILKLIKQYNKKGDNKKNEK